MRQKILKAEYTTKFKEPTVKRVKDGQGVGAVAKEMALVEQTRRNWAKGTESGLNTLNETTDTP